MKAPSLLLAALVTLTFAGVAHAGPLSPLYLTFANLGSNIVVQGNSVINTFPQAYGNPYESPIAVWGDVRTTGVCCGFLGGQYSLSGIPTGTSYAPAPSISYAYDSTSDGFHNYLVDFQSGVVYQTARDFTNPVSLFTAAGVNNVGITYDAANKSLWITAHLGYNVADYALSGALLSSFDTGHFYIAALALDPADHTLWLVNDSTGNLEQYSTAGVLLSTGPYVGYAQGGEFNLEPATIPEPGALVMFGSGILGLLRRKINL